ETYEMEAVYLSFRITYRGGDGRFLRTSHSYTLIRDLVLRLFHRMMAHSIASRSQAPEKVIVTDLFYLRGMDIRLVNNPYLLAHYFRRFAAGRKSEALIFGGKFVARLDRHIGLLTEERLWGLTVTAPALLVIDMAQLVRLQICEEIDDIWAWVALGPERQSDVADGAPGAAKDALVVDEGDQAIRGGCSRVRGALAEQHEVIGAMAKDFSRFIVWAASGIAQLLDSARVTYTPYSETHVPYQRRVRRRTDGVNTSTT
ncbi:hypothetical protein Tco_1324628, partial [Tanacetum coccineum]